MSDYVRVVKFTILGAPIGKPRMTQRDGWRKVRPCVAHYRAWADSARLQAPKDLPLNPISVSFVAYMPMPDSWSQKKKMEMAGKPHRVKPDLDNILKAVLDVLWENDQGIYGLRAYKYWAGLPEGLPKGPRLEVEVY